jgi:V-type H+-transporting ATPase subunit G
MATSQVGIKQLLEAEQKAQEIVNKARKDRVALLKQAKEEAEKEVAEYKAKRTIEYEAYAKKHLSGTENYTKQLSIQSEEQIRKQEADLKSNSEEVINILLKFVEDVYY